MTDATLQQIVGPGSALKMIIANVKTTVYRDPAFGWCPELTPELLSQLEAAGKTYADACKITLDEMDEHVEDLVLYQWGSGNFLNNTDIYIKGVPMITHGIAQTEFTGELYFSAPEFSLYLNKNNPYD